MEIIGGVTNRLVNSDFIQGTSGYNSRNVTLSIESGCSGFNALKIISTVSDASQCNGAYGQQKIPVEPGDKVFASLNYKGSGMNQNGKMEVNIYDSTGNRLSNGGILLTNQDDWTYAEYNVVVPDKASYITVNFFVYNQGIIWIDSPQLSINVNGNYTPSVTALGDQVQSLQNQIGEIMTQVAKIQSGGVAKPLGGRNLLLDSRTHRSNAWLVGYDVNHQDNGTFMGFNVYKTSNIWDGLHYHTSDLVSRGVIRIGEKYTFSIYIKVDDGLVLDSSSFYFFNGDNAWKRLSDIEFEKIGTEWAQISIVIQYLGKSDTSKDYIGFEISKNTDGKYYYSACPQLERGTTASDYRPAPEDTASDMTNVQQQLAMITTKIAQLETDKS